MTIAHQDETLKLYLEDIRKTAPVQKEEEQHLFILTRKGNRKAREKLVQANMRFVLKVALQYKGCPLSLSDLVSEGTMGLIRAIESFDHTRGLKFISYAVWWIKAYVTRAINEQGSLIRLPANQHLRVRKAIKDKKYGEELADDIQELIMLGERGVSFDTGIKEGSKTTYQEILPDERATTPEHDSEMNHIETIIQSMLSDLPKREAQVLKGIFGICDQRPQTLREVGDNLNVSHERVRQLRDQALRRIRKSRHQYTIRENYQDLLATVA
jgi:RNA polymerase primary sigma factor